MEREASEGALVVDVEGRFQDCAALEAVWNGQSLPARTAARAAPSEPPKTPRTWVEQVDEVTLSPSVLEPDLHPTLEAIVDEAHALGMRVAAHAHTAAGVDRALDAGVDSIEHGTLLEPAQSSRLVELGVTVAPTLLINNRIAQGVAANAEQAAKAQELVVRRDALLRAAAESGVDFVLGTDANGAHVAFGDQMEEIRRMAEIFGWSPERALQSATSRAAAAIGWGDTVGMLRGGAAADFVVLRGRPWERIDDLDTSNIVAVVAAGQVAAGTLLG